MSLNSVVSVSITNETPKVSAQGFGIPMILGYHTAFPELIRYYTSLSAVGQDFAITSAEYRKAAAMFAQSPAPARVAIGRRTSVPTWGVTLTPTNTTEGYVYSLTIGTETFTYTVQASDTVADVIDGLVLDIAGATQAITATDNLTSFDVDADSAGVLFDLDLPNDGALTMLDTTATASSSINADLAAIFAQDTSWYGFVITTHSDAEINSAATFAAANKRFFSAVSGDAAVLSAVSTTDVGYDLSNAANAYTKLTWHHNPAEGIDAAQLGLMFPKNPGSATWEHKTFSGISASSDQALSASGIASLEAKNVGYYKNIAGVNVSRNFDMANGEYPDIRRGIDWAAARIAEAVFGLLSSVEKVPYTEAGFALVESAIRGVLQLGVRRGLFIDGTIVVNMPDLAEVTTADKAARLLQDVEFSAQLQGAIHTVTMVGRVYV